MSKNSAIKLAHHTFNPWREKSATRSRTSDAYWRQPLAWNREAEAKGERHRVFCASLADVFEDWQGPIVDDKGVRLMQCSCGKNIRESRNGKIKYPMICGQCPTSRPAKPLTMDDLRRDLFALIDATPHLDWLLLTKRPENIRRMWPLRESEGPYGVEPVMGSLTQTEIDESPREVFYRPNCWLGTSLSLQKHADAQIPELLKCRDLAPVLFLSVEPLLGPVDFAQMPNTNGYGEGQRWYDPLKRLAWYATFEPYYDGCHCTEGIDWVIVGGESGKDARPCNVQWIRDIVQQCKAAAVPVFVKQMGSNPMAGDGAFRRGINDPKGGNPDEWPADLRVREMPESRNPQ